jgi:hypothetical protein
MITIDYQPVLALENESKIVFTDSAKSEPSYLYMDKFIAPSAGKLVWMEIRNPNYNPDDPDNVDSAYVVNLDSDGNFHSETEYLEHPDNPLYLFRRWMWLENVLSNTFPVNYAKDVDGQPITKEDGSFDLGYWDNQPGMVKLELYEHKHVLTRQASMDNANVLHRLTLILNRYNNYLPEKLLNELSWEDITEFLSLRKVKLDYGVEYQDEEGNPLPSEYPPVTPHHCHWKQRTLSFCLQDLLRNFESRLLSVTLEPPDAQDYLANGQEATALDEADVLTSMKWRYRRPIEYREDILYEKILWPIDNNETVEDENNAVIYFRQLTSTFGGSSLYNPGYYDTRDIVLSQSNSNYRSRFDFICNLYPYSPTYPLIEFDTLVTYLKKAHVNVASEYEFTCKSLPADFYENSEWSNITLSFTNTNYNYLVEHTSRPTFFGYHNIPIGAFNAAFKGIVKENLEENGMVFSTLIDITNNVLMKENIVVPTINDVNAKPNDVIHGIISGEDFIIVNRTSLTPDPDGDLEIIPIRFEGNKVESINWTLQNFNPAISDALLEFADPDSVNKVHNYTYEGFTNLDTNSAAFNELIYDTDPANNSVTNIRSPNSDNICALNFVMRVPEEERKQAIVEFLTRFNGLNDSLVKNETYINAIAEKWLYYYERIQVKIGIHHNVTKMYFFHYLYDPQRVRTSKGIHPDLDPVQFEVSTFPGTIPGIVPTNPTHEDNWYIGMPVSIETIRARLYRACEKHFNSFDKHVYLSYLPPE